jgi:uncharacterized protein YbjQ (UPF0145 family)
MLITTTDTIPGREVTETLGLVSGNVVRARAVGRDIVAAVRNLTGGDVKEYRELLTQSRADAVAKMAEEAAALGADAIVGMRFATAEVMQGTAEILAYGTAVKLA